VKGFINNIYLLIYIKIINGNYKTLKLI